MLINEKFAPKTRPIKVLQFGEGNFLRCFVDWIIQNMNEACDVDFNANVCVVQPLAIGMIDGLKKQNGLYTVLLEENNLKKFDLIVNTMNKFYVNDSEEVKINDDGFDKFYDSLFPKSSNITVK